MRKTVYLIVTFIFAVAVVGSTVQESISIAQDADEMLEELPDLLSINYGLIYELYPEYSHDSPVNFLEYWEQFKVNISLVTEVIDDSTPEYISNAIESCGAEYVQLGIDYINFFCVLMLDSSVSASTPHLENEYFRQTAIDWVEEDYSYLLTWYETAYGKEPYEGKEVRFGLPEYYYGTFPVLGDIPEEAINFERGDRDLKRREIVSYFSEHLSAEIGLEDLEYVEGLWSFVVEYDDRFWYYPAITAGSINIRFFIDSCQNSLIDSDGNEYGDWFICGSDFKIDPQNPPYFDCINGDLAVVTTDMKQPSCFVENTVENVPEGYLIWSKKYHHQDE